MDCNLCFFSTAHSTRGIFQATTFSSTSTQPSFPRRGSLSLTHVQFISTNCGISLFIQGLLNKKNGYDQLILKKKVRLSTQIVPKWIVYAYVALMREHATLLRSSKLQKRFMILSYFKCYKHHLCKL